MGRPSLSATLASFAADVRPEDHVVVVSDGGSSYVRLEVELCASRWDGDWTYHWKPAEGCWGHPLRNSVLNWELDTDYVWSIDDDDVAAPGALDVLRSAEGPWTIFRMLHGINHPANGIVCWREPSLRHGDIGTPMILARPSNARFGHRYEGDWDYAEDLRAEYGDPAFDERVVAVIRP